MLTRYMPKGVPSYPAHHPEASASVNLKVFISNLGQRAVGGDKAQGGSQGHFKLPLAGHRTVQSLIRSPGDLPCSTHGCMC